MTAPDLSPQERATVARFDAAPDALADGLREEVAEVLSFHLTDRDESAGCAVRCGYDGYDRAAHLADALLPLIERREQEARRQERKQSAEILVAERALAEQRGAARALRDAAGDVPLFEFMLVMGIGAEVAPAQIAAWLRARAARLEGDAR